MKLIVTTLCIFISVLSFSQTVDIVKDREKVQHTVTGNYLVQKDTSETGVITIVLIPSIQITKDIESKLGTVSSEIISTESQIEQLQSRKKELLRQKKELEKLLQSLSQPRKKK